MLEHVHGRVHQGDNCLVSQLLSHGHYFTIFGPVLSGCLASMYTACSITLEEVGITIVRRYVGIRRKH